MKPTVSKGEFNGHPTLEFKNDDADQFTAVLGKKKAAKFMENIDQISTAVEANNERSDGWIILEIENGQYDPWKIRKGPAAKWLQCVEEISIFAGE